MSVPVLNGIQLEDPTTFVALLARLIVPCIPPFALNNPVNVAVPVNEEVPVTPRFVPTLTDPETFTFPLSTPRPP